MAVLPPRASGAIERALKVDQVGMNADFGAREAYEARAAASDPSGEA